MILRRAFPRPADTGSDAHGGPGVIDLESADARAQIAELYRAPSAQWLRINLVGTLSGSAVGPDGTSDSITGPVDRVILRAIRSLADVVVVGAASVRAEGYFVPREAALAIVSGSGDLSGRKIRNTGEHGPLLVLCPYGSVDRARDTVDDPDVRIITVPDVDGRLPAAEIVRALRGAGYNSIVAEGGPELAAHLATGGVVDELCLTTSPQLNGATLPLFGGSEFAAIPLSLEQLLLDDSGATYARWRFPNHEASRGPSRAR